jgi:type IV secretory pathway TraG/TraD family ATPase VirD4
MEPGKERAFLMPNLLMLTDRSIIVIDPKGELATVTANYRRTVTANYRRTVSDVVTLNPFDVPRIGWSVGSRPAKF